MSYAAIHRRAARMVKKKGAPVTFTKVTFTEDEETGHSVATTASVVGNAVQVEGKPHVYERLTVVESKAPTLLFTPDTYGEIPDLGSTVTWGGELYTAIDVEPLAPDGTAILSRVVVDR